MFVEEVSLSYFSKVVVISAVWEEVGSPFQQREAESVKVLESDFLLVVEEEQGVIHSVTIAGGSIHLK